MSSSSKVADAKRDMKEYLKTRRKRRFESCIIYKPVTLTFDFKDDDLHRGQADKGLTADRTHSATATASNTTQTISADEVTTR